MLKPNHKTGMRLPRHEDGLTPYPLLNPPRHYKGVIMDFEDHLEDGFYEMYETAEAFEDVGDEEPPCEQTEPEGKGEMGIAGFGMALGLGDEMSQGRRRDQEIQREEAEIERDIEREMADLHEHHRSNRGPSDFRSEPEVMSLRSRGNVRSGYDDADMSIKTFKDYLDAVLDGRIDVEWARFNRQG